MKTRWMLTLFVFPVAIALMAAACGRLEKSWQPPRLVRIESDKAWISYFPMLISYRSDADPGGTAGLFLHDGDLISIVVMRI